MFAKCTDQILEEIGTEQVRQIHRALLSVEAYGQKDKQVRQFFL